MYVEYAKLTLSLNLRQRDQRVHILDISFANIYSPQGTCIIISNVHLMNYKIWKQKEYWVSNLF